MQSASRMKAPGIESVIADSKNHSKIGGRTSQAAGLPNPDGANDFFKCDDRSHQPDMWDIADRRRQQGRRDGYRLIGIQEWEGDGVGETPTLDSPG